MQQASAETTPAEGTPIDRDVEAYCLKCRGNKTMVAPLAIKMKNGRDAARGKCPDCNTTVVRTGKH